MEVSKDHDGVMLSQNPNLNRDGNTYLCACGHKVIYDYNKMAWAHMYGHDDPIHNCPCRNPKADRVQRPTPRGGVPDA